MADLKRGPIATVKKCIQMVLEVNNLVPPSYFLLLMKSHLQSYPCPL